ncbi:N-acetylglucosamine-6-phosphate deacetylase [Sorangium cellulosum]|uniref:N-acetylglucosamine-6-phosphate deacetylase n=1 Tax=Sorangium cellulosum TaxID=56 RepID=A0A150R2W9_SORCE|nr:N-acetylglucosamine-6-phosphate deacetylase [Sorangium cellulosum]
MEGNILTPEGWLRGRLRGGARVEEIEGAPVPGPGAGPRILPGFIDLHVHGGGGRDVMEGGDAPRVMARAHAATGTTSLLATTMTAPAAEITSALRAIRAAMDARSRGEARILGVHLEGPFLNPGRLGAQPPCVATGDLDAALALHAVAPIRVLTLAPELAGHLELVRALSGLGVRVQIGHTLASYEDVAAALAAGASGFTHLFNAMNGLHHREPGAVGAALAHGDFAELIPDLVHVHPGAIRAALRCIPRLYAVTDGTAASGMPDGPYRLGAHAVTKCQNSVRLPDGTLAGSCLTMHQAFKNLVGLGLSVAEASRRCSLFPAEHLGLEDRGRVAPGCFADLLVLDEDLALQQVLVEGEPLE